MNDTQSFTATYTPQLNNDDLAPLVGRWNIGVKVELTKLTQILEWRMPVVVTAHDEKRDNHVRRNFI